MGLAGPGDGAGCGDGDATRDADNDADNDAGCCCGAAGRMPPSWTMLAGPWAELGDAVAEGL
jgi:hypothetical protein